MAMQKLLVLLSSNTKYLETGNDSSETTMPPVMKDQLVSCVNVLTLHPSVGSFVALYPGFPSQLFLQPLIKEKTL